MKKLSYSYSMGGNSIEAGIAALEKRIGTLVGDVQKIAVSILRDFKTHGDKPTAAKRANALAAALGKGMRANSLRAWFETHAPFVWNNTEKMLVPGFTAASPVNNHANIDVEKCIADLWQDALPPEQYKPLADWTKSIAMLVKRADDDIAKMGDKSKVNRDQLELLRKMAA